LGADEKGRGSPTLGPWWIRLQLLELTPNGTAGEE
jgi:hypothetical protein